MKRNNIIILCLMLISLAAAVPVQAVTWTYYDGTNQQLMNPKDDEINNLAAKRVSDTNETHFALRIAHDFTAGIETGYFENIANPSPPVGLTWVKSGDAVNCTVNGAITDTTNMNIRYVVTGYTGNAPVNQQFKAVALQFDGIDSYVEAANVALAGAQSTTTPGVSANPTTFSIQFFAKRNRLDVAEALFSQGASTALNGFEIGFTANNEAYFTVAGGSTIITDALPSTNEWHSYKFVYKIIDSTCDKLTGCKGYSVSIFVGSTVADLAPGKEVNIYISGGNGSAATSQTVNADCNNNPITTDNIVDGCYEIAGCSSTLQNTLTAKTDSTKYAFRDISYAQSHWNTNSTAWGNWDKYTVPRRLCADDYPEDGCDSNSGNFYCKGNFIPDSGQVNGSCYNKWYLTPSGGHKETRTWTAIWSEIKRQAKDPNKPTISKDNFSCSSKNLQVSTTASLIIGKGLSSGSFYNGQIKDVEVSQNGTIQGQWAFKDGGTTTSAADTSGLNHPAVLKNFNPSVAWITSFQQLIYTPIKITDGLQKISFNMTEPARLIYKWQTQYAVSVNSLPSTAANSTISANGGDANCNNNGKFWFFPYTNLALAAKESGCLKLQGYRKDSDPNVTISAAQYQKTLTEPFGITWVYGDYLYLETVTVGSPVSLATIPTVQRDVIQDEKPTYVSTSVEENDMCVWSEFENKMYPVRGGETFDLEFLINDPKCPDKRVNLRVTTKWPQTPHYIHVAETPPVNLDPSPDDGIAFLGLKFSEANTKASVSGTNFTALDKGRSVLLFTRTYTDVINPTDISLKFDGQNDYAEIPISQNIVIPSVVPQTIPGQKDNFSKSTIAFWAKVKGGAGKTRTVISSKSGGSSPSGFDLFLTDLGQWRFMYCNGYDGSYYTYALDVISSAYYKVTYDEWVHIAVTINSSPYNKWDYQSLGSYAATIYINGVSSMSLGSNNVKSDYIPAGAPDVLRIGTNTVLAATGQYNTVKTGGSGLNSTYTSLPIYAPTAGTNYFNGQLDDLVIIPGVALSESEISQLMTGTIPTDKAPYVTGFYRFDKPGADSVENSVTKTQNSSPLAAAKLFNMDPVASYITEKQFNLLGPAVGDLGSEYVYVRVVETRSKDDNKFPLTAEVGSEIFNAYHDSNVPHNGYVFYELSPYNAEVYDRATAKGPIYPVNIHHPSPNGVDTLLVIWYKMQDGISWPYQPVEYTLTWPTTNKNRIVIASRLGSEGKDSAGNVQTYPDKDGNLQNYFDPARYSGIKIYNQPDTTKPGYNPNEEHALCKPSLRYAAASPRPYTAYALRNDLNITTAGSTYTSHPYVLVQYFDEIKQKGGMQIYKVDKEDAAYGYTFRYDMKAGEPIDAPYPLNTVISVTPPTEIFGKNGNTERKCYWEDHKGQPWAISGAGKYLDIDSVAYSPNSYQITLKTENALINNHKYMVQVTDSGGVVGSTKFQVGVAPTAANSAVYVNALATQTTQFTVQLNPDITGLTKENFTLVHYDSEAYVLSYFWYPLDPSFWFSTATPGNGTGEIGKSIPFLPTGTIAAADGFTADMLGKSKAVEVRYDVIWPKTTPILKAGETIAFPGGEYRADNNTDGLPGVIGWAAGQIVFDDFNPKMDTAKFFTNYLARLVPILEERTVSLASANFPDALKPINGKTEVIDKRWYFKYLNSGLKARIFYDPLSEKLGIRGFINDKTLGDKTLTATPPPIFVVQPNILTLPEKNEIYNLEGANTAFQTAVTNLYSISRNPLNFANQTYTVGLDTYKRLTEAYKGDFYKSWMSSMIATYGDSLATTPTQPIPQVCFGPGLALVPNGAFLDPTSTISEGYITLAENNHPDMGASPVALHIVKVVKDKYRGAIKTMLSDNVFDEKIMLRHTADFGANPSDLIFQWYYREDDGTNQPPPDVAPTKWTLFGDLRGISGYKTGQGMSEISLAGAGAALLADNLFFVRYQHVNGGTWSDWAGAANSRPGSYQAQLCEGWVKRVMFAVNPFEARVKSFTNSDSPATYVSMIQQAGPRYEGAVAFNPAKDVIENVGLIQLYQTVLNRAAALSINLSQPVSTSGITSAILLAAGRIADFYILLGNEAYIDALDPTIGYGSSSTEYGSLAPTIFCFMNQEPGLLEEELDLFRGRPELGAIPTYNRLLWNFTHGQGEVAYALSYNIQDLNKDGFIDEKDAQIMYPQGHGDAWGHYLTALKGYYDLLTHPYFNWESRAELASIQGVVINVDYLDERKFTLAAAAKAKVGKELINLTYRSKYVEDPDGQWQGYKDTDTNRAWGVTEWGRKAFAGAYFDWVTANAILPAQDTNPNHQNPIQKIDRTTVKELLEIAANARGIHQEYDNSNAGLNPLGLTADVVPFDINPGKFVPGQYDTPTHFEQIYERADTAIQNALVIFDYANDLKNKIRQMANSAQEFSQQVEDQDRDYRNRLIEIYGKPYNGLIGAGKSYPAGYSGPDYRYYFYIDVNEVSNQTVPQVSSTFSAYFKPMNEDIIQEGDEGINSLKTAFSHYFNTDLQEGAYTSLITQQNAGDIMEVDFPTSASKYSFQAPAEWGIRDSPGEIQQSLTELVKAEADVLLAMNKYSSLLTDLDAAVALLKAASNLEAEKIKIGEAYTDNIKSLNAKILGLHTTAAITETAGDCAYETCAAIAESLPKEVGLSVDPSGTARGILLAAGIASKYVSKGASIAMESGAEAAESEKEMAELSKEIQIEKAEYKYEVQQKLKEIEALLNNESAIRVEIFKQRENMRQISQKYQAILDKGERLSSERKAFNAKVAAKVQGNRYLDMAFRLNMNDSLSKYRSAFDMAARYVYMAAKAYDYETNLPNTDPASAKALLKSIVQKRTLGQYKSGQYIVGQGGLGDVLGKMKVNFSVLKTQMGFNNPQTETDRFSMRTELFRIKKDTSEDATWRNQLAGFKVADLWAIPEFRRFCRPFAAESAGAQPGLVIPFASSVTFGNNFFGWPLSGGDHAYDPTNFATKVRSVGIWFDGYDNTQLSETPRAYLVPVGMDIMLVPNSFTMDTREWTIVDQKIPVPLPLDQSSLKNTNWIPRLDSTDSPMIEIRRYSSFRAYHDKGYFDATEMSYDSRLIGRSVWNTRWMLIIPGGTFLSSSDEGLNTFIYGKLVPGTTTGARDGNGVKDIKMFFQTYAISGN